MRKVIRKTRQRNVYWSIKVAMKRKPTYGYVIAKTDRRSRCMIDDFKPTNRWAVGFFKNRKKYVKSIKNRYV